jgi:hypothetical protein
VDDGIIAIVGDAGDEILVGEAEIAGVIEHDRVLVVGTELLRVYIF